MLKLIRCKSAEQQLQAFSEAQAKWAPLQYVSGFIRQWGGWVETEDGPEAVVLVLWKSKRDYLNFMAEHHDAIYERTNQKGTFESINITLFEEPAEISKTLQNNAPAPVPEWTIKGCRQTHDSRTLS
ncbi:YdbC family protein [Bacillus paralicheniformis]|uniref:YdbC family protein n=1 Tax=Bacillus paralicheniformis TaxID=1648923 RepID=UPI0035F5B4DE